MKTNKRLMQKVAKDLGLTAVKMQKDKVISHIEILKGVKQ